MRDDATVLIIDWYGDSREVRTRLPIANASVATRASRFGEG